MKTVLFFLCFICCLCSSLNSNSNCNAEGVDSQGQYCRNDTTFTFDPSFLLLGSLI